MGKKILFPGTLFSSIFLAILLSIGLTGCDIPGFSASKSTPTPAVTPTVAASPTPTTQTTPQPTRKGLTPTPTPLLGAQNCGSITTSQVGVVPNNPADQGVGNCFWQAYQQCRTAFMMFRTTAIDTIVARTFTLAKSGLTCQIIDASQHISAPNRIMNSGVYTCTSLTKDNTHLLFKGCGADGDVVVPLSNKPQG